MSNKHNKINKESDKNINEKRSNKEKDKAMDNNITVEDTVKKEEQEKDEKIIEELKEENKTIDKITELQQQINELNDKYLRLYSEYDNYRKRTIKEKLELSKDISADILRSLLNIFDDIHRASKLIDEAQDIQSFKEGFNLIMNKFNDFLKQKGVEEIKTIDESFDTDLHEAISNVPAPSEEQKGKIIEEIQKGYKLDGKVIRFAKVIVGS
jgi:molecular chaperone GrpE